MVLIMWGGVAIVYFVNLLSDWMKMRRRRAFVKQIKTRHFHSRKVKNQENASCSICLMDFEERDVIKILRCNHTFHAECIDPWLMDRKAVCPVCRQGVFDDEYLVRVVSSSDR